MDFELIPITKRLNLVVGFNRGRFPSGHAFLVKDEVCALIDSGCGIEIMENVRDAFPIDLIINSHGHPDHCAGNWLWPDVPLYAPQEGMGTHGRLSKLARRFFGDSPLADMWPEWIRKMMGFQDRAATHFFGNGHVFDFGDLKLHAVHTPGHTADHYCFLEPKNGILLSFDIDLTPFGPWYGNLESDLTQLRQSLAAVQLLEPKTIATSHSEIFQEDMGGALQSYAAVLDARNDAILRLIKDGVATRNSLIESAPIYGRYPYVPHLLRWFEGRMLDLHVEEMIVDGRIRREYDGTLVAL